MRDDDTQAGREAVRLGPPVAEQRGRHHDQARRPRLLPLHQQEQRQHLQRLAEPHVVGEAGAQPEAVEEPEPGHAIALVGPQHCAQRVSRIGELAAVGAPQVREHLVEPRPGRHLGPRRLARAVGRLVGRAGIRRRAGQEAHALEEREPFGARLRLDRLPVLEHLREPRTVHHRPLALDQDQPVGAGQDLSPLGGGERLPVEGHADLEVEQRAGADARRLLAALAAPSRV